MKTLVALVGTKHRGKEMEALLASLPQGEPLTLIRERGNKHDPFAVQVWAREQHVGFIKATQVKPIALAMDRAAELQASSRGGGNVWQAKLAIDGGKWPMVEIDG
jgi:hypothetical protein